MRACQARRGRQGRDQALHALRLGQQRAQVLVEQRAGQARPHGLHPRAQVRTVEELRVLEARAQHRLVAWPAHRNSHPTLLHHTAVGPLSMSCLLRKAPGEKQQRSHNRV